MDIATPLFSTLLPTPTHDRLVDLNSAQSDFLDETGGESWLDVAIDVPPQTQCPSFSPDDCQGDHSLPSSDAPIDSSTSFIDCSFNIPPFLTKPLPSIPVIESSGPQTSLYKLASAEIEVLQANAGDENLTPSQRRRKAQNRVAQRAFRERKERRIRDLEASLADLESVSRTLKAENERLRLAIYRATMENKSLHSILLQNAASPPDVSFPKHPSDNTPIIGHHPPAKPKVEGHLLTASATWDLIQGNDLVTSGKVDVVDVWQKLQTRKWCGKRGPAWDERDVVFAIECGRQGTDEKLI